MTSTDMQRDLISFGHDLGLRSNSKVDLFKPAHTSFESLDNPRRAGNLFSMLCWGMGRDFGQFLDQIKGQVTRGHERSHFAVFNIFFNKLVHNSGTRRATAPQKSAFDSYFNALLQLRP